MTMHSGVCVDVPNGCEIQFPLRLGVELLLPSVMLQYHLGKPLLKKLYCILSNVRIDS